jgi:hypothetical protein
LHTCDAPILFVYVIVEEMIKVIVVRGRRWGDIILVPPRILIVLLARVFVIVIVSVLRTRVCANFLKIVIFFERLK